jgi:hypothetical protein
VKRELAINVARTLVDGKPVEKAPKTRAGQRTLPLDAALAAALTAFQALQVAEKKAASEAYADLDYVLCNELGQPYDPARLRRLWYRLMRQASVRKIKPYDAAGMLRGAICLARAFRRRSLPRGSAIPMRHSLCGPTSTPVPRTWLRRETP